MASRHPFATAHNPCSAFPPGESVRGRGRGGDRRGRTRRKGGARAASDLLRGAHEGGGAGAQHLHRHAGTAAGRTVEGRVDDPTSMIMKQCDNSLTAGFDALHACAHRTEQPSLMFPQSWRHQAPGLLGWERTEKILDGCLFYSDLLFGLVCLQFCMQRRPQRPMRPPPTVVKDSRSGPLVRPGRGVMY
jgi:hypothetical protein